MQKKIVIIIPAYNEEGSIVKVIESIPSIKGYYQEIIVVNDGSTDNTLLKAEKTGVKVITNKKNLGLGKTFKIGIKKALSQEADIIVNLDADGQYESKHILLLITKLEKEQLDLVIGNRFLDDKELGKNFIKRLGNKVVSIFISKILLKQKEIFDIQSGFRAFNSLLGKFLLNHLNGDYTYTQEMMIAAIMYNFKIKQIPTKFYKRTTGDSRLIKNPFIYLLKILFITFNSYIRIKINQFKAKSSSDPKLHQ